VYAIYLILPLRFPRKTAKRSHETYGKRPGSHVPGSWSERTLESRGILRGFYFSRQGPSYVRTRGGCSSMLRRWSFNGPNRER